MGEVDWERARLFPVSGIGGADEQERRAASALLAVIQSVREFGRAITIPMGAPAGRLSAFIEVPFRDGDRSLRPDGLIQVISGQRTWTALVEVKTGRHDLIPAKIESYLDVARKRKFDALLTISLRTPRMSSGPSRFLCRAIPGPRADRGTGPSSTRSSRRWTGSTPRLSST